MLGTERIIWVERAAADGSFALRGPGESYSDVILRLVEIEAKGREARGVQRISHQRRDRIYR
jgi:hypothetical protein